jgi:hypothetical protein
VGGEERTGTGRDKATEVVRRLPRAGVALPMPFLGDHGNKQQKKKNQDASRLR